MKWERLTSPELHALDRNIPVILPIAAIEQHGPHLPLATDSLIADHFMERIDDRIGRGVLTLPTIRVACSGHHMFFTGTLTVSCGEAFSVSGLDLLEAVYPAWIPRPSSSIAMEATRALVRYFWKSWVISIPINRSR
ncbi:MAG: creatininase family protein [Saprospiraceae bacterium]